jgi:hypothetical protein
VRFFVRRFTGQSLQHSVDPRIITTKISILHHLKIILRITLSWVYGIYMAPSHNIVYRISFYIIVIAPFLRPLHLHTSTPYLHTAITLHSYCTQNALNQFPESIKDHFVVNLLFLYMGPIMALCSLEYGHILLNSGNIVSCQVIQVSLRPVQLDGMNHLLRIVLKKMVHFMTVFQ